MNSSTPMSSVPSSLANGHHGAGDATTPLASSSTTVNGFDDFPLEGYEAQKITGHLYMRGFKTGDYSDINLYWGQNCLRLHRLVLAQSPMLAQMIHQLQMSRPGHIALDLVLALPDPNISDEAMYYCLGSLYSPPTPDGLHAGNARAILAAALFFGLEGIVQMATQICADAIQHTSSPDDIATWVTFIDSPLQPLLSPNGLPSPAPSLIDPPPAPTHTPTPSASNLPDLQRLRYGGIAIHLRDTLFHHLAIRLPAHHAAFAGGGKPGGPAATTVKSEGTTAMLEVYARLPFALFKAVVESEQLQASDMERFTFAKRCVSERKRLGVSADAEETVVLAFVGGRQAVTVVRKPKRGRQLWKAGHAASASQGDS